MNPNRVKESVNIKIQDLLIQTIYTDKSNRFEYI